MILIGKYNFILFYKNVNNIILSTITDTLLFSETIVLLVGLGTLGGMIIKVSNSLNNTKRDLEKLIEKGEIRHEKNNAKIEQISEKTNAKIEQIVVVMKFKHDQNADRITNIENFLSSKHNYGIRVVNSDSRGDFDKLID